MANPAADNPGGDLDTASKSAAMARCANCDHPREDRFCPKCGQNDRDYVRALPPLLGDILKETFELDSRIVRTIKPMFLKPGELAAEFSRNRRARYVSPIRLYLFASIAFFFALPLVLNIDSGNAPPSVAEQTEMRERPDEAKRETNIDALKANLPRPQQRKVDEILSRQGSAVSKAILYSTADYLVESGESLDDWDRFLMARAVDAMENPKQLYSLLLDNLTFAMFVTLPAYALLLKFFFLGSRRYYSEHLVFAVQLHTFAFIIMAAILLLPADDALLGAEDAAVFATHAERQALGGASDFAWPALPTGGERPRPTAADASRQDPPAGKVDAKVDAEAEDDDSVFGWIALFLFLWIPVYHYLALRRYYRNGRLRTACKWSLLSICYGVLLIPGFLLSLMLAMLKLN